ncbi:MAG: response regulator [Deltaproteobacteria bacterium]|nr:response regulator [Deltaproteobacteria bacterium]
MDGRILFVDDDPNILEGYRRLLRGRFLLETAADGHEGLAALQHKGPFEVVVSDFRMPIMDGIQFLTQARALAPDTVRIMLTGFAEIQTAIEAVNEGNIFRFLTKPCPTETLLRALQDGIRQYQLITAERELLDKTLKGSIQALTEILSLLNPEALGRGTRVIRYVRELAEKIEKDRPEELWELETAAMLSQIGCILLPPATLEKALAGEPLSGEEKQIFQMHPSIAFSVIHQIPRLENIADSVLYQAKGYDGSGIPLDTRQGEEIPLGARILRLVLDFDDYVVRGLTRGQALVQLKKNLDAYDPFLLGAFELILGMEARFDFQALSMDELKEKMIVAEDIFTKDRSRKLISKGYEITRSILGHLEKYQQIYGIAEPVKVMIPLKLSY